MYIMLYTKISAEHLASPKPGTNKNWFGTSHFAKQLVWKQ